MNRSFDPAASAELTSLPHLSFEACSNGDIDFSVVYGTLNASVHADCVFDPFPDLLRWLEAITTGVQRCAWEWDACGPDFGFTFERSDQTTGHVVVVRNTDAPLASFLAPTHDIVEGFYRSFVEFAASSRYVPEEWQEGSGAWFGQDLRRLRSPRIEAWLDRKRSSYGGPMTEDHAKELARAFIAEHIELNFTGVLGSSYDVRQNELIVAYGFRSPIGLLQVGGGRCVVVSPTGNVRYVGSNGE